MKLEQLEAVWFAGLVSAASACKIPCRFGLATLCRPCRLATSSLDTFFMEKRLYTTSVGRITMPVWIPQNWKLFALQTRLQKCCIFGLAIFAGRRRIFIHWIELQGLDEARAGLEVFWSADSSGRLVCKNPAMRVVSKLRPHLQPDCLM